MNPYQVLGVSETATDEEVKAAYRRMVKKYHPDRYTDSALKEQASEKLKEVNAAYDAIVKIRKGEDRGDGPGGNSSAYGMGGRQYRYHSQYQGTQRYAPVKEKIRVGDIGAAEAILLAWVCGMLSGTIGRALFCGSAAGTMVRASISCRRIRWILPMKSMFGHSIL